MSEMYMAQSTFDHIAANGWKPATGDVEFHGVRVNATDIEVSHDGDAHAVSRRYTTPISIPTGPNRHERRSERAKARRTR